MSMSMDESICAYFVNNLKPAGDGGGAGAGAIQEADTLEQFEASLEMLGQQLAETQIRQIKPSEGYPLIAGGNLTKKDVFVLAQFEGDFFDQLQQTRALILGPPCLITCLRRNEPIPEGSKAIYTTAMRDLQVSATGITPQKKEELSRLIHWMGGTYFQSFGHRTTHLISNTIKSSKYEQATLNGVPVMHVDWVQYVWDQSRRSQREGISATDPDFDKYRLPIFFGANITCSGLDVARKDQVMRLVNENGGIYHRAFRSQVVDIVITEQSKTDTDKYKAAIRYKKDVLLPEWIFDSSNRGYALPTKDYEVRARKTSSTPTKSNRSAAAPGADQTQLSDLSRISFVSNSRRMCSDLTTVNESVSSVGSSSPAKDLLKQATTTSSGRNYQQVLAEICPRQAKKAGAFLDGCCVYLSGFRSEEREKLNRVLNTGGATRYDEANEGISHIIVGQLDDAEYRQWQRDGLMGSVHVVRLDWLLESIRAGRLVSELVHRVSLPQNREPDVASPASKRTLRSMNHSFKQPTLPIKKKLFDQDPDPVQQPEQEEPDHTLLDQYSQDQGAVAQLPPADVSLLQPAASSTQMEIRLRNSMAAHPNPAAAAALPLPDLSASTLSIDFDKLDYFSGHSVYVHKECFNAEFFNQMLTECETAQGLLVPSNFKDEVDFAIVSFEVAFDVKELPVKAREVVTELYLESCMKKNQLLPLEYYHKPIPATALRQPLKGMTIVVSIYAGLERDFINAAAELLGASVNKTFIKKEKPLLVCPNAEGSKYEGAIKWNYPVVTSDWLVQCARTGQKLPYVGHLVGKSPEDFPISPRLRESNTRTPRRQTESTLVAPPDVTMEEEENQPAAAVTPVAAANPQAAAPDLTPLRNRRVSELAGIPGGSARHRSSSSTSSPDSPCTPLSQVGAQKYNLDFLEQFVQRLDTDEGKDCVREIIREMQENQTPELERIRRQACTPISRKHPRPAPGIPDFCLTPEFQQRMADDFERRWRLPTQKIKPDTPLAVIRQRVMRITCETLGIEYEDAQKQEEQEQREPPSTQKKKPPIRTQATKLNFDRSPKTPKLSVGGKKTPLRVSMGSPRAGSQSPFVPNTQSPTEATTSAPRRSDGPTMSEEAQSTINFDKISFEESAAPVIAPDVKQITDYLKNCESRRNSLKRSHDSDMECPESEVQYVQPFESEGFALGTEDMVDWRDPAEFNAAKRRSSGGSPKMQYRGTPCFSISCGDDGEKRAEMIERITQLGGKLCENLVNYDDACTHLLCERPNRGEKMLACIASGKWIVNMQYIEQCHTRGYFLDETLYEWGNPKAINMPTLAPEEEPIAAAVHRWRTELAASGGGAFSDHRVILSMHERSGAPIRNVLRAGGATILEPTSPFSADPVASTATHCFVDMKKAPLSPRDMAYLHQCGVQVLSQIAINTYLMNGRDADLGKYELN
ncbi:DNA topoisomerase 2-binding protein 1 [Drosophila subpulchrella]|uniref:DNA topoisomerase 2-binding protein 1 n=1 Tax=Drosophila subpulchrella TaxID=1486046 RepID=UPI0018A19660|nr:DNA topoisomerase 2-binding protein 1 [Drosophila subpulchrella]